MPTFKLDGREIPFEPGESIIKAAWRQGIEIPHYCWHPGLSAPANCRMCLVEIKPAPNQRPVMLDIVELDRATGEYKPVQKPKLMPACQMPAVEGQEVFSDSSQHVKEARSHVQEFLLLNHPVDCPICDQAGECKLQDYWLEHQGTQKRMRDEPIHKPKGVVFGPTIVYDGERCVMCTRCIRFMEEVAKDPVLEMRERGNLNEIFVAEGRKLDGNYTFMVEHVCPVGALTTQDFRFKARVWFLRSAKSVCQGCATGCNAYLDYDPRYNKAHRYRPRDNEAVNKFWMCDPGMLSYKRAHEGRITEARVGQKSRATKEALAEVKKLLGDVAPEHVAFVLGAQASLEDNWSLLALASKMGSSRLYWTGAPAGASDDILISADKSSNQKGVLALAPNAKPYSVLLDDVRGGVVTHVVALGSATPAAGADDASTLGMLRALVAIAAHDDGALTAIAHVVLPACSWAEAPGTYVNKDGLRQLSDKALEPIGASKPGWEQVAAVAKQLGHDLGIKRVKEIRAAWLGTEAAAHASPAEQ
ncbi:MAG: (2Fe-2S)-binding protein [Myxococcales bacterium]|jgi:NADH-quinone oxidoreductase subunit G|nr:(2Fe-2S)-binding protein [Myxococcales bacterium]